MNTGEREARATHSTHKKGEMIAQQAAELEPLYETIRREQAELEPLYEMIRREQADLRAALLDICAEPVKTCHLCSTQAKGESDE